MLINRFRTRLLINVSRTRLLMNVSRTRLLINQSRTRLSINRSSDSACEEENLNGMLQTETRHVHLRTLPQVGYAIKTMPQDFSTAKKRQRQCFNVNQ